MDADRICELSLIAVNDNGDDDVRSGSIHAALRHFASNGLEAALAAGRQAEQAAREGDDEAYRWWFGICRTLDKRLAGELRARREIEELAGGRSPYHP